MHSPTIPNRDVFALAIQGAKLAQGLAEKAIEEARGGDA